MDDGRCLILFVIGEIDEVLFGYVGDCDSTDIADRNDDTKVFLETFQDSHDTRKRSLRNLDILAWLAGKVHVVEEDDLIVGIVDNGLYVLHLLVGDMYYFRMLIVILVIIAMHEVANALVFLTLRLYLPEA